MNKELTFNFDRDKIIEYCREFPELKEQIEYLKALLLEYKTNPQNFYVKPNLEEYLQMNIYFREYIYSHNESTLPGLLKINGANCRFEVINIIDAMIQSEMVKSLTEIKMVLELFFSGEIDQEKNDALYNNRLNEMKNGTTEDYMLKFLTTFAEESFKENPEVMDELIERLIKLK